MKAKLTELIDFEKVDILLEGFNKTTGFVTAILDLNGKVLSKSGWRQMCTEFHRINPETSKKCTISDIELSGKLAAGEKYHCYKCLNGLVDVAVPIVINGEHIANLFSGQFFFEEPDRMFFKKQAGKYGFDEKKYLEALEKVPVVSKEKAQVVMDFLLNMTQMISELTFQKAQQFELNAQLIDAKEKVEESECKFRLLHENAGIGIGYYNVDGTIISYNNIAARNMNGIPEDFNGKSIYDFFPKSQAEIYHERIKKAALSEVPLTYEDEAILPTGDKYFISTYTKIANSTNEIDGIQIVSHDITERKQAVETLLKSEGNLSITLNSIGDAVISTDKNGFVVSMNPVAERLCGWSLTDALGKPLAEVFTIINAETRQTVADPVAKVLEKGEIVGLANHTVLVSKLGAEYQIDDSAAPIRNKEGAITGIVLVFSDITESYKAQKHIKESEERYGSLLGNLEAGIVVHAPDTSIVMNNHRATELLGLTDHQLRGKAAIDPAWKFIHEDKTPLTLEEYPVNKVTSGRQPIKNQVLGIHQPGKNDIVWVTVNGFPVLDNKGEITEIVISFIDITERKQAEEELRGSEEEYRNLIEFSPVAMAIIHDWKTIYFNPAAVQLFGAKTQDEILGKHIYEFIHPDFHELATENAKLLAEKGHVTMQEQKYLKLDGSILDVETQAKSIQFNDHSATLVVMNDITERKKAEKALKESEFFAIATLDALTANIAILDEKGVILAVNRSWQEFAVANASGLTDSVFAGENYLSVCETSTGPYSEEAEQMAAGIRAVMKREQTEFSLEYPCHSPNEKRWYNARVTLFPGTGALRIVVAHENITNRKLAEEALRESKENLSITLHSIGDGVISTDINGLIVQMNPVAEKLCGWELTDALGKPLTEVFKIINAETRQTVADPVKKVLENGEIVGLANHTVLISKDCTEYQIADSAAPIKNKEDSISGVVLVFSDVTEKYASQKQIKENEERFDLAMKASSDGLFDWNLESNEIYYAPAWKKMLGYEDHELPNDFSVWEYTTEPEDVKKSWELQQKLISRQIDRFVLEFKMKHKDGHWVDILSRAEAIFNDQGKAIRIVGTHTDISERKQAEAVLRESEEHNKALLSAIPDMMFVFDKNGVFVDYYANKNSAILTDANFFIGKNIFDVLPPQIAELTISKLEQVFQSGELQVFTYQLEIDHELKDFESRMVLCGKDKATAIVRDITERKQAEEALRESEERFKALHNASFGGISIHDKGIILECNQGLVEMTGYSMNELIGMDGLLLIAPDHREMVLNKIISGYEKPYEANGLRKNGELFPMRLEARNVPYKGKNVRTVEFRDTTEQKQAELELITAKLHAEESDRLKSAFLANMSHEIRTPMNGILGFAGLLKEPDLTGEQQQEYIAIIEKSGARMLNIINDIVDISKIEAGLMKLDIKESNINEQIEYIYTFFKPEVEAKGMKLLFKNALPANEAIIKTDREKVYSILTNLVKNAIKYCKEGTIEIGYSVEKRHGLSLLQFYVKDTGIGIPKERQEAIFERFIQADIMDVQARQGAGLGLAITKSYVEMLDGKIWVESEVGKGSTFFFTLPYHTEQNKENESKHEMSISDNDLRFNQLKILIVEDDESSSQLISITVRKFGKEIIYASNGIEAVEVSHSHPDIDLILMDIQMPELNGYEATRQIREFNSKVIIIAQTAYALAGDREKAIEAGCNDYVSKPINKVELNSLIAKYLNK